MKSCLPASNKSTLARGHADGFLYKNMLNPLILHYAEPINITLLQKLLLLLLCGGLGENVPVKVRGMLLCHHGGRAVESKRVPRSYHIPGVTIQRAGRLGVRQYAQNGPASSLKRPGRRPGLRQNVKANLSSLWMNVGMEYGRQEL